MHRINKKLASAIAITSFGDFLSVFAYVAILSEILKNPVHAAFIVPIKGIGVGLASLSGSYVLNRFGHREILFFSQIILGILSIFFIVVFWGFSYKEPYLIFLVALLESFFSQLFLTGREVYSKVLEQNYSSDLVSGLSRIMQAELEKGYVTGQFGGPLLFFLLIEILKLPYYLPLALDSVTFFIAAMVCWKLPRTQQITNPVFSLKQPIKRILEDKNIFKIFFVRGIGFWVSLGLINFFLFSVITDQYNLQISYSAIAYSAIGLGAWVSASQLANNEKIWSKLFKNLIGQSNRTLAASSCLLYGVFALLLISTSNAILGLIFFLILGFANGIQKISTRAFLRSYTCASEYSEILGIEFAVGKIVDISVCYIFGALLIDNSRSFLGIQIAAGCMFLMIPILMRLKERKFSTSK